MPFGASMYDVDSFPDPDSLNNGDLRSLLRALVAEERELAHEDPEGSYKLRVLHGKIDIIRAELVKRRRRAEGGDEPRGQ